MRLNAITVEAVRKPNVRRQREVRPVSPFTVERLRAVAVKRRKHGPRDAVLIGLLAYAGLRRLLAPLASDLTGWRLLGDEPGDEALLFPNGKGGVWNDPAWQTWHRDSWRPACRAISLEGARPYDLRHSFVSLLISEGRSVVDVARQAGHSPTMTLDVYAHVFDEFDIAERVSAEDQIEQARRDVSESCPPDADDGWRSRKPLLIPTAPSACRGSPS
jgi:integrase